MPVFVSWQKETNKACDEMTAEPLGYVVTFMQHWGTYGTNKKSENFNQQKQFLSSWEYQIVTYGDIEKQSRLSAA
jgi:hypothetical protein